MKLEEILELIQAVSDSNVTALEYKEGKTKLSIKVGSETPTVVLQNESPSQERHESVKIQEREIEAVELVGNVVTCPLVGTFYSAASEESEAFVKVGDQVKKGQTLAIIEAMKLMNEIESDYDGVVEQILVNNGEGVEYGQPLFVIQ